MKQTENIITRTTLMYVTKKKKIINANNNNNIDQMNNINIILLGTLIIYAHYYINRNKTIKTAGNAYCVIIIITYVIIAR